MQTGRIVKRVAGILVVVLFLSLTISGAEAGCRKPWPPRCPAGDVKYEVGQGYEYTNGTAYVEVSDDGKTAHWWPDGTQGPSYCITSACVKVGGPWGGYTVTWQWDDYYIPDSYTSPRYDISHVVLTVGICVE